LDGAKQSGGGLFHVIAARAKGLGDALEYAAKAGTAHGVLRRKVGAAVKGAAIGKQEAGQRPAALAGDGADGRLITDIHVGRLIAINFHWNEMLVDEGGESRILIAFAVDDVAPVAPDRADIQQDGFIFGASARKSLFAPLVPFHWLMRGRAQVGTDGIRKAIGFFSAQVCSFLNESHCTGLFGPASPGLRGLRPAKPSFWRCQKRMRSSPRRQQRYTSSLLMMAGKSRSPESRSLIRQPVD